MYSYGTTENGADVMTYKMGYKLFVWHGGAYIDVCIESTLGNFSFQGKTYVYGEECINVWDYDRSTATIEWKDVQAFIAEVESWAQEMWS